MSMSTTDPALWHGIELAFTITYHYGGKVRAAQGGHA
jgi:hypothetical protein